MMFKVQSAITPFNQVTRPHLQQYEAYGAATIAGQDKACGPETNAGEYGHFF